MIGEHVLLAAKLRALLANKALDKLMNIRAAINIAEDSMTDKGTKDAQKIRSGLNTIEVYLKNGKIQEADNEYEKISDLVIEWVIKGTGPGPDNGGGSLREKVIAILAKQTSR